MVHAQTTRTIESITSQDHFEPTDSDLKKRDGPLVVAYDGTAGAVDTLQWTLDNLAYQGDLSERVEVVHVVCDPRALTAPTGVGGSVRAAAGYDRAASATAQAYKARLHERAREAVQGACGTMLRESGIPHKVATPELEGPRSAAAIGGVLLGAADAAGARALVVANHGPGVQVDFGSVARYCYTHAGLPLVLVPQMPPAPATPPSSRPAPRTVVLVVARLQELEAHWQWVAANCCRPGDKLQIWHINPAPANTAGASAGLASLPTALAQVLRAQGLADVAYKPVYNEAGVDAVAAQVAEAVAGAPRSSLVVVMNYARAGMVAETLAGGSVASQLTRTCPAPLVLLEPPQA